MSSPATARLIAEFTNGSKRVAPKLTLAAVANGRRTILKTVSVSGRAQARSIAAEHGAQAWNF